MGVSVLLASFNEANNKCGQEKRDALAQLVNDCMVPDEKGIYVCDGECAFAKEILTQATRSYKKKEIKGMGRIRAQKECGGPQQLEDAHIQRDPALKHTQIKRETILEKDRPSV
eukprot:6461246-Amphidinium_carterae.1